MADFYGMVGVSYNMKNMDIFTILKSNIKHKKGTFISLIILMTIVTTVICAIISVRDNYKNGFENAYKESDCGDAVVMIDSKVLSDDLKKSVENSKLVEKVDYTDSLLAEGISFSVDDSNIISYGNSMFLTQVRNNIRLYNKDESGFENSIPPLKKCEIYLPLGCKSNLSCSVGDKVEVTLRNNSTMEFKVKGFVQEPSMGSSLIGVKQLFISSDDYNTVSEEYKKIKKEKFITNTVILNIHQAKDSNLSPTKFQREINIETKIADMGYITINKDSIIRWSTLMPDIIINIVIVFCMFLFVIVLIVISHSISTEIELEYKTIGILKSQGFTSGKIRFIMFLQYMIAQIMGIVLGIFFAFPVEKAIGKACQDLTAVLADTGISVVYSLLFALAFIICSSVIIFIKTHKLRKISPIKAINGGHEQIYFESRLNMPISKKLLSPTLALRQFTSGKKRYAGIILMGMILTFFMITVNLLGGILNSKTALNAMGIDTPDMSVSFKEEYIEKNKNMPYEDIENMVKKYTDIEEKQIENGTYCSLNGEYINCQFYKYPQYIGGIIKGREPKYKNELIITDMVADALDLKLGDKVTVSKKEVEKEFIVSGIFQSTYDSGMTFAINYEGARSLKMDVKINYERFTLKDKTKTKDIKNEINQKYGENALVYICKPGETGLEEYKDIIDLLKIIIYSFSIIFAFVVVRMVCVKTFIQERKDIGIFKALGFTSNKLRLGFAIRFFISALIGSAIGIILSILLSAKSISAALSMLGIVKAEINYAPMSIIVPVLIICIGFFVFSFIASRKIRKVETKELIVE